MAKKSRNRRALSKNKKNKKVEKSAGKNTKRGGKINQKFYIGLGVLLVIAAFSYFSLDIDPVRLFSNDPLPSVEGLAANTPRITVDQEIIDYGEVKHNTRKIFSFKVFNSGNDVLEFKKYPWIEVVKGC
jgi:hypothetical protein